MQDVLSGTCSPNTRRGGPCYSPRTSCENPTYTHIYVCMQASCCPGCAHIHIYMYVCMYASLMLSWLCTATIYTLYVYMYMYVHLLEVPKQWTCIYIYQVVLETSFIHTVRTCLLLRNFQQNSCSAQPGQHSHVQASCFALQLLQSKAKIYTQDSFLFKEKTALSGIQTHDTPRSRRALYQLSYQGNSAG